MEGDLSDSAHCARRFSDVEAADTGESKGRDYGVQGERDVEENKCVFVLTENVCREAQSCHSGGPIDCQWSPRSLTRQRHLDLRAGQRHLHRDLS